MKSMKSSSHLPAVLRQCSLVVSDENIRTYAELTNDFNPLHVDADFAAKTSMGRQIAHGTMSLCLLLKCFQRNLGDAALSTLDMDVRFVKPIFIGDEVHAGGEAVMGQAGTWNVWVRGADGVDRIVGTALVSEW